MEWGRGRGIQGSKWFEIRSIRGIRGNSVLPVDLPRQSARTRESLVPAELREELREDVIER